MGVDAAKQIVVGEYGVSDRAEMKMAAVRVGVADPDDAFATAGQLVPFLRVALNGPEITSEGANDSNNVAGQLIRLALNSVM